MLRPTTSSPILVCHPDDADWWLDERYVLPGFGRVPGPAPDAVVGDQLVIMRSDRLPKGLALLESLIPRVVEFWNGLLDGFSQTEVKSLIRLLTRLLTAASGQRDKPGPRQAGAPRARIRRSA